MGKEDTLAGGVRLETPLSSQLNTYLDYLSEVVQNGFDLKETFTPDLVDDFKNEYDYHNIHNKRLMYEMVNTFVRKFMHAKKSGKPNYKTPLNSTFNVEYQVKDKSAGVRVPRTIKLNLLDNIQLPILVKKYDLEDLETTVQSLMEHTSDMDFTMANIPEVGNRRFKELNIKKSFVMITPEYTGKFKGSRRFKESSFISWIEYRSKNPGSLAKKLFDVLHGLDSRFMTPLAYEGWSIYRMSNNRNIIDRIIMDQQDKGFTRFRQEKKKGVIGDVNAVRIVTPEESYMRNLSDYIQSMYKLGDQDVKIYLESEDSAKANGYQSIHLSTPNGEIQLRTLAMHYTAENQASKHDTMKELCERRRWHYMALYPETKETMKHLNTMFPGPRLH